MEDGYVIDRPNRAKQSSQTTRAIVVLLLLVSALLQLIVIVGGWSALQGSKPVQIVYALLYVGGAILVGRWNRGVLPVVAAMAILLLIFAAVSGPEWLDRDKTGFSTPQSMFGGDGLESSVLALITLIVIPVQILLIAVCAQAFRQDWHVELEVPKSRAKWSGAAPRRIVNRPGQRRGTTGTGAARG
ncbi:hypothetical protein Q5424_14875 [Conexibacter sp. JD483]|uniref:hypothetical protein n=1 Tax=unclassified Conexibacter TaxID=2627773 RepID=UPI0027271DE2|nr:MULTISPECIES: hypothetical protein [unclassified Conexibacter]MDO8188000.1 hypothetical protein [Conexibacter sp. CPCC 205706]MDO8200883.1 hypothetical protein [Conexibacter sp. CPCC 205762]MDR9370384.1 hypothetical protein [Conexibacter sp. JD483]